MRRDFLPYVKGGWAWTDSTVTHYQTYGKVGGLNASPIPVAEQAGLYRSGWTIGGGLAYHIWQNWEMFGQYMCANYGTASLNSISAQRSSRTSLTSNALTFGANLSSDRLSAKFFRTAASAALFFMARATAAAPE